MLLKGLLRLRLRFHFHLVTSARRGVNELSQTALVAHSNAALPADTPTSGCICSLHLQLQSAQKKKYTKNAGLSTESGVRGSGGEGKLVALSGPPLCTCLLRVCFVNAKWFCFCFITLSAVSVDVAMAMTLALSVYGASVCPSRCPVGMVMPNPRLWPAPKEMPISERVIYGALRSLIS